MSKNIRPIGAFKKPEECKGQSKIRGNGKIEGLLATGGSKIPFSFIANVGGIEYILGQSNNMFMLMTDEQKEAMKKGREHCRNEDWLDRHNEITGYWAKLFNPPKPQKFKRTPVTEIRKTSPRPYFNKRVYDYLLMVPNMSSNEARRLSEDKTFSEAYLRKMQSKRLYRVMTA